MHLLYFDVPEESDASVASLSHEAEHVRNLISIKNMVGDSALPTMVKARSIEVFTALAEAEAKTHGSTVDQVSLRLNANAVLYGYLATVCSILIAPGMEEVIATAKDV